MLCLNPAVDGPHNGPMRSIVLIVLAVSCSPAAPVSGSSTGDDGALPEPIEVSVFDVQGGKVEPGTLVTVRDVIVTTPVNPRVGGVFVQEPEGGERSGIYLALADPVLGGVGLAPGVVVSVTGVYDEVLGRSQIAVDTAMAIEASDPASAPVPSPRLVSPGDIATGGPLSAALEGVLVRVEDVEVIAPDLGYGEFAVTSDLRVDDFFFALDAGPTPSESQHLDAITGPLLYSVEQYKIAPRSLSDLAGWPTDGEDPGASEGPGDPDDGVQATIYELQGGGVTPGTAVILDEVVVTSPLIAAGDVFFVQEPGGGPYSGIAVRVAAPAWLAIEVGMVVTISGVLAENDGNTELHVAATNDVITAAAGPAPPPTPVDAAMVATGGPLAEAFEGVLIEVVSVTVAAADTGPGTWELEGGLRVEDLFFTSDWPTPIVKQMFASIAGCMVFANGSARLAPRSLADLVEG